MLTVDVRFVAFELTPGLSSGEYEIEAGASIRDLLRVCEGMCGRIIPEKNFQSMYPLFNGMPVTLDTALTENGSLHLCRVVVGG